VIQPAISTRPGTILGYQGDSYKVIGNDTLDRILTLRRMKSPHTTRRLQYGYATMLDIRWKPDTRI
jgi:hypothetical protein